MFKSYFIIGVRNLLKQKGYSLIKIAGLAFGLAASLIIYLYVKEDLSYDTFHPNYDRIVRVMTIDNAEGVSSKLVGVTQLPLGPTAEAELPEVIKSVRFQGGNPYDLSYEDNTLKNEGAFRTESAVFDMFNFRIIEGKRENVLDAPNSIVITKTLARKIFGNESAVGKTLKLNQSIDLNIVAVMEDVPKNSHLQFDLLRSLTPGENEQGLRQALESWGGISAFTYLLLDAPLDKEDLSSKLKALTTKNNAADFFSPTVQALADVHLRSKDVLFEANANKSDILNVYVLSTIAVLILLLAAVNFVNLVTAKSAGRAKEVGMRKVIGAVRNQLVGQHLVESILVTFVAAVLAIAIVYMIIPLLNNVYQRFAPVALLAETDTLLIIASLVVGVGLIAGLYPAFVLSAYKPSEVLKGDFRNSTKGVQLRKALVVLQFTISIALMVGTGIVYQQMRFIYTKDLGYNRDQVITIQQSGPAVGRSTTLKDELLRHPGIVSAGTSSSRMGQQLGRTAIVPEGFPTDANIITSIMVVDETFIPTMGMQMVEGRNFSLDFKDSVSMIINEEMLRLLKWDEGVGRTINLQNGPQPTDLQPYQVVGVVKDFHFATVRHRLEPMFMLFNRQNPALSIKINAGNMNESLAHVEATWKKVNPGTTFEYNFLDEQFANLYRTEKAFSSMFTHFTVLALTIAGLGLFALSAFTAEQRKKEIGIRKVLGANNGTILYLLSAEFIKLILIAFVLASALAYYVMSGWLKDFQYAISIGYEIFVVSGVLSVVIALATVSFQALKAALANPVNSIRNS